jgi:molybdopterin synthase catalytic subunit
MARILVQEDAFDLGTETASLLAACPEAGAVGSFLGVVRSTAARPIAALTLEHYPAMTERALAAIVAEAEARFALLGCTVIHRFGRLPPGAPIVLVLAAASHRQAALNATGFLIDWLKTAAPFWKKETLLDGTETWVEARAQDDAAAARW